MHSLVHILYYKLGVNGNYVGTLFIKHFLFIIYNNIFYSIKMLLYYIL